MSAVSPCSASERGVEQSADANSIAVTGARPFYDLTNPVIFQRDEAITADVQDKKETAVALTKLERAGASQEEYPRPVLS